MAKERRSTEHSYPASPTAGSGRSRGQMRSGSPRVCRTFSTHASAHAGERVETVGFTGCVVVEVLGVLVVLETPKDPISSLIRRVSGRVLGAIAWAHGRLGRSVTASRGQRHPPRAACSRHHGANASAAFACLCSRCRLLSSGYLATPHSCALISLWRWFCSSSSLFSHLVAGNIVESRGISNIVCLLFAAL